MALQTMAVVRQWPHQIRNTQHWSNWEVVFSMQPLQKLRDATREELLEEVSSMWSVPRLYNEEQLWYERVLRQQELVVRQSPASKDMNMKAEEATALEAITRWQPVKTQKTEKTSYCLVNCRVCELVTVL
jgi:hypothetical protein